MKKVRRAIRIIFLLVVVIGVALTVRYFTSAPEDAPIAKPVLVDESGETYLAVVDGEGTTYAVVTDAEGNRYAAEFNGSQVGSTVGQINDQVKLEDIPGYVPGDALNETPSGDYHGSVSQQKETTTGNAAQNQQGAASDDVTAAEGTTSATEKLEAYRIQKYSEIFKSGNYLMEFTTDDPTLPSVVMATKNGETYMETTMDLDESGESIPMKMIFREDGNIYVLFEMFGVKKYSKFTQEMLGEDGSMDMSDMVKDFVDTDMGEITVSRVSINGQSLILESYISAEEGATINYYFDGDVLVRRDIIYSNGTKESIYISRISDNAPDSCFQIPSDYGYLPLGLFGSLL